MGQADTPERSKQPPTMAPELVGAHDVIEALYDLPLGGNWNDLQAALCRLWSGTTGRGINEQAERAAFSAGIERLERHFERALAMLERLPGEQHRWRRELHRVPLPAAVFTGSGQLLEANSAGRACFEAGAAGEPVLPEAWVTPLRRSIEDLQQSTQSGLNLPGPDGDIQLLLSRLPWPGEDNSPIYIGVMISSSVPQTTLEMLRSMFGLTEAEARLCTQLAGGASLENVASEAIIKRSTLRTHLRNAFQKLGVSSQPELVAVVLQHQFASIQLESLRAPEQRTTPYLDPELHGYPRFDRCPLPDGRQLGYFEYGDPDGIPAFYLHGSMDCGLIMKRQKLEGCGIRLFAVERGGVGESTPNRDASPQAYARDLIVLADTLELERYAVIGRSMGSWDALTLAQADRNRVALLALVGGRLPIADSVQHDNNHPFYFALFQGVWKSDALGHLMLRILMLQLKIRGAEQFVVVDGITELEAELARTSQFQRHMKAVWQRVGIHGVEPAYAHLKLYEPPEPKPSWLHFDTPTLLLHGESDTAIPLDQLLQQTSTFKKREVKVFPGLGHRLVYVAMGEILRQVAQAWHKL